MSDKDIAEDLQETDLVDETEAPAEEETQSEKMLPVSRVNKIVQKAKRDGEKKMQEQLDAAMQQIEQLKAQQGQQQNPAQPQGLDAEAIQNQIIERLQQQRQEEEQQRQREQIEKEVNEVAEQFYGKMSQGNDLYEDFEDMTKDFDAAAFPQLVYLANQADNTAAIIYELQKNPAKLAQLAVLVERSPAMARNEIGKLSNSIKNNLDAKNNLQESPDPLNRLKPSTQPGADSGMKTVRDFKGASFLRG